VQEQRPFPSVVEIVVEIPRGSRNKYEYDETTGVFRLDRVLSSAIYYNFDYGFVEGTRADEGDHTDALLIIDEPTFTGRHVWARPIGGLRADRTAWQREHDLPTG
jgi:inorganic pyrophosphatase